MGDIVQSYNLSHSTISRLRTERDFDGGVRDYNCWIYDAPGFCLGPAFRHARRASGKH
jgi:hypothetical protein